MSRSSYCEMKLCNVVNSAGVFYCHVCHECTQRFYVVSYKACGTVCVHMKMGTFVRTIK